MKKYQLNQKLVVNKKGYEPRLLVELSKKPISQMECYEKVGTTRMSAYIFTLRLNHGFDIKSKEVKFVTRDGRKSTYERFYLADTKENQDAWEKYWSNRK
jgi:hypothetical protein